MNKAKNLSGSREAIYLPTNMSWISSTGMHLGFCRNSGKSTNEGGIIIDSAQMLIYSFSLNFKIQNKHVLCGQFLSVHD